MERDRPRSRRSALRGQGQRAQQSIVEGQRPVKVGYLSVDMVNGGAGGT
jgi:hypothetical protein